jgi:hypothetical protein
MKKRISKKTLLHDEVQSRISKMLYNKNIIYQNNPVDNTETNSRLIKSFLYRKISSKYPKYNSFTKILTINNLDDNELSNLLLDLPNLDELYNNIQKYKEKRNLNRKNQSRVSDEEDDEKVADDIEEVIEPVNVTVIEHINTVVEKFDTVVKNIETVDGINTIDTISTVVEDSIKSKTDEDELTSNESNELNENFNLTDKIIIMVKKIVIVYAFYRLAKWFI